MAILVQSNKKPSVTFPEQTGSIVTFNSQYAGLPLKSHTVDFDSVSGVSAINISATGKNLVDITDQTVTTQSRIVDNLHLNKGVYRFTIRVVNNTNINGVFAIRIGTTNIKTAGFNGNFDGILSTAFNLTENSVINIILGGGSAGYSFDISNAQIEIGTALTPYTPYNGSFTTITIGSTVNEATYNARTGVMEVTQPSVQTLQLPPCPIDTLEGVNNIWADTGETTVQYIKIGG